MVTIKSFINKNQDEDRTSFSVVCKSFQTKCTNDNQQAICTCMILATVNSQEREREEQIKHF